MFQVSKPVHGIFIKTTRNYKAIPCNHISMPKFPAVICQFVFRSIAAIRIFLITAEFSSFRDQLVRVSLIIIDLCCLKSNFVYSNFLRKFFDIFYLVLIGLHNKKLKKNKRSFAVQFFFPFNNIPRSLHYFFKTTAHAVLLINILGGPVYRNDQPVKPAFNSSSGSLIREVMCI